MPGPVACAAAAAPWVIAAALACATPPPSEASPPEASPPATASVQPQPPAAPAAPAIELEGVLNRALVERLDAPAAWRQSRGEGVLVAVMDNGFYQDDPLMAEAYVDEELRFQNVAHRQDVACAAHGSSIAATIAARPNGPGTITGVAPAAKILRLSFGCPKWIELDPKQLTMQQRERLQLEYLHEMAAQGAGALDWAVERGAKIINLSTTMLPPNFEQLPASARLADADWKTFDAALARVRARGVIVVAAAGNWTGIKPTADGTEWQSRSPQGGLWFPASSPAALAAGCACGEPARACEYDHTGAELGQPQLAAVRMAHHYGPGLDFVGYCDGVPNVIRKGSELIYGLTKEGGTSNAAPEVAAILALAWAAQPAASADAMLDVLQRASTDLGVPGYDERFGFGVPNAARAVALARASSVEPR